MHNMRAAVAVCLIGALGCALFLFQACGKKGNPVPPRLVPPQAVTDLRVFPEKGFIRLSWTLPDGRTDIARIKILRSDLEIAGDDCPGCPRLYATVEELSPRDSRIAPEGERGLRYLDEGLKPGRLYTYKVVLCDAFGYCSRDSNAAETKMKE